jgi:hypothetical protein
VGITVGHLGVQPDKSEKLFHPFVIFAGVRIEMMDFQGFTHNAASALPWVERTIRVLKN